MFYSLLALKSIDDATNAVLDLIGKLVGEARNGHSDADYRKFIRVRLATNRSRGLRSDYIRIVALLFPTAKIEVRATGATVEITVHGVVVSASDADILMSFLQLAHGAGVRVILGTYQASELFSTFAFRAAAVLAANTLIGASSFTFPAVVDVRAFPAIGHVKFMTTNEVVAYTVDPTWTLMTVKAPGLVQAHTAGEIVELCNAAGSVIFPEIGSGRGFDSGGYASGIESIDP
jgi:hypothetical protein